MRPHRFLKLIPILAVLVAASLLAHETDQFTSPPGREYSDLGDYMTAWVFDSIDRAVAKTNSDIRRAKASGKTDELLLKIYDAEQIADAVYDEFPNAYGVIEGTMHMVQSREWLDRHPGLLGGYKPRVGHVYQFAHLPIDIRQFFKIWFASTVKVYGVYLGSDKLGHFVDMGHNYYKAYIRVRKSGRSEAEGVEATKTMGTKNFIFSESGVLGNISAGAYSNADLVANHTGYLFYRNLSEPMKLKGVERPAMLVREGVYWKIAPHVGRSSDFFSWFISEHYDEALNPSLFDFTMRRGIRSAVSARASNILWRFRDVHGCQRPPQYFDELQKKLQTYYGDDYGFKGRPDELVLLGQTCFEPVSPDSPATVYNPTGHNALHWAVVEGKLEAVKKLLDKGFDVNSPMRPSPMFASTESRNTALHLAARDGREEIVTLLLERGANATAANSHGVTPLHRAGRYPAIAQKLLAKGAAAYAKDSGGRTPLHWAALDAGATGLVTLLEKDADANAKDNAGLSPLHLAAQSGSAANVAQLLQRGASVGAADALGVTPLHIAAERGDAEVINALLAGKANINAADAFGATPLHTAAERGHLAAVQLLVQAGAKANAADATGSTPLHLACRFGRRETVAYLLNQAADAKLANRAGMTPLHEAAYSGDKSLYRLLVQKGGDEKIKNRDGRTPKQIAEKEYPTRRATDDENKTSTRGGGGASRHIGD